DAERVLAKPHDDDAADRFPASVQFSDAATDVRAESHLRDVADADGGSALVGAERDVLNVLDGGEIAAPADHVLAAREFEQTPLDGLVANLDGVDDRLVPNVERGEFVRVEIDLILLDEAADARHFRYARHGRQPVPEVPVLQTSQIGQRVLSRIVDERVLKDP